MMNGIELRLFREELHMTLKEFAGLFKINTSTLFRMEKGYLKVPESMSLVLFSYFRMITKAVENFKNTVESFETLEPPKIVLIAYNEKTYDGDFIHYKMHDCVLAKCKIIYPDLEIISFDPEKYNEWRKDRKDTQDLRAQWALAQ